MLAVHVWWLPKINQNAMAHMHFESFVAEMYVDEPRPAEENNQVWVPSVLNGCDCIAEPAARQLDVTI